MIILAYITFTLLLSFSIVIYGLNSYWRIYQEEVYLNRFVVVKTALDIYPTEEEEGEYSEDIRKLISGAGVSNDSTKIKRATTQTVIDLEEILLMQEWTSSKFEDQEVKNDCVMITFRSGDQILVLEPLGTMEKVLVAYQSLKSLEGLIK
jgi:hypothetical protein